MSSECHDLAAHWTHWLVVGWLVGWLAVAAYKGA